MQLSEQQKSSVETCTKVCDQLEELHAKLDNILAGFPKEDPVGHRLYHEEVIESIRARKDFWRKLTFELTKWGLIGFVAWAALSLWTDFLKGPKG